MWQCADPGYATCKQLVHKFIASENALVMVISVKSFSVRDWSGEAAVGHMLNSGRSYMIYHHTARIKVHNHLGQSGLSALQPCLYCVNL